ncbi:hypothetical protein [Tengunoibacter tsumagoiensis]|uniref:Uncharacterized protein n=1 Tax=Tengunoibacter tsumagoiensis TaxID=2014871 RepID=A0A402A7Q8_9CHLR|nr:hypothetical protein [Tengunoibacter tsumagoiensis]GCE15045.1 hypothetical protein KTT_49040 [Tengunoibacter tsumagoiensis]
MQNTPPQDSQEQNVFNPISSLSGSQPPLQGGKPTPSGKQPPLFYTVEEDDADLHLPLLDEQGNHGSPFVLPFQNSAAMPTLATTNAQGQGTPPPVATPITKKHWGTFQLLKVLLIGGVVLITIIGASLFVFAQATTAPNTLSGNTMPPQDTNGTSSSPTGMSTQGPSSTHPPAKSPVASTSAPSHPDQGVSNTGTSPSETLPSTQLLSQSGWTQAGLTVGDAVEAFRTGSTFTDREMSYDYRNSGTPTNHSGTLTSSTFLLTSGGKTRFVNNDVRMINNVLYNKIQTSQIIQQVVPKAQPALLKFQIVPIQGQPDQFAWLSIPFELLQSKIDPTSKNRTEGLEIDPKTNQPLLHHMTVILVRVPPQNQGENAPMGGTGWLVNTYELDTTTLPDIATNPSL